MYSLPMNKLYDKFSYEVTIIQSYLLFISTKDEVCTPTTRIFQQYENFLYELTSFHSTLRQNVFPTYNPTIR